MRPTPGRRFEFRKRLAPHTTQLTRPAVSKHWKIGRSEGIEVLREIASLRNLLADVPLPPERILLPP